MQKTSYERRISDWMSDVCSPDLDIPHAGQTQHDDDALVAELFERPAGWDGHHRHQSRKQQRRSKIERVAELHLAGACLCIARAKRKQCQIGRASCREREYTYV